MKLRMATVRGVENVLIDERENGDLFSFETVENAYFHEKDQVTDVRIPQLDELKALTLGPLPEEPPVGSFHIVYDRDYCTDVVYVRVDEERWVKLGPMNSTATWAQVNGR